MSLWRASVLAILGGVFQAGDEKVTHAAKFRMQLPLIAVPQEVRSDAILTMASVGSPTQDATLACILADVCYSRRPRWQSVDCHSVETIELSSSRSRLASFRRARLSPRQVAVAAANGETSKSIVHLASPRSPMAEETIIETPDPWYAPEFCNALRCVAFRLRAFSGVGSFCFSMV